MTLRIIFILLLAFPMLANEITSVTVYPGWAYVTRTVEADGSKAKVTLPAWVQQDSIIARGAGVLATHRRVETTPALSKKEAEAQTKAIDAIRKELDDAEARHKLLMASAKTQRDYFAKLMEWKVGAPPQEMTTRRFTDAEFAEFVKFRDVLADLDSQEHESNLAMSAIRERMAEAEKSLKEAQAKLDKSVTIVDVDLAPGTESFTLAYRIPGATWHPTTEVTPVGDSLRLNRRALIRQVTGEDWTGVELTLRNLDLGDPTALYHKIKASIEPDEDGKNPFAHDFARYEHSLSVSNEIAEFANLLGERREHKLADSASILSGSAVRLDLATDTVPTNSVYSLNAQSRDVAWRRAEFTPKTTQMFGPLKVNVNRPFTVPWSNVVAAGDQFNIGLGGESGITIDRQLVRESSALSNAGDKDHLDLSYRLTVRNTLANSATIVLDEPMPDGQVSVLGTTPAAELRHRALRWHLELDGNEIATFEYAIRWTYPTKDKPALAKLLERALH